MLYIREWLLEFRDSFLLAIVGSVLLCLLSLVSLGGNQMHGLVNTQVELKSHAYFTALVESSGNLSALVNKMKGLPGVMTVEMLSDDEVSSEIKALQTEFGASLLNELRDYKTLKIILSPGIHVDTAALVKEYFARLAGSGAVSFSKVKTPSKGPTAKISLWSRYVQYWVVGVISISWLFVVWLGGKQLKRRAYIIERFQRKKYVALKLYAVSFFLPILLSIFVYAFFISNESLAFMFRIWPVGIIGILGALIFSNSRVKRSTI